MYPRRFSKKGTTRSTAGARANKLGKLVERGIDNMHHVYRMQRLAVIARLNVPTRLTPATLPNGQTEWKLVQCGKAPIDFAGTLAQGQAIFVEVKATGTKAASLNLVKTKDHERHQLEELAARHRMGAHALLLWWNEDRFGILTGDHIDRLERAEATNAPADLFIWMERGAFNWLEAWQASCPQPSPTF